MLLIVCIQTVGGIIVRGTPVHFSAITRSGEGNLKAQAEWKTIPATTGRRPTVRKLS